MAIDESSIQLLASERLTDYEDGGGMMTGKVIVDGASNNVFDDISELDRVYGRVSLRKVYAAVRTALAETYYGSHVIVARAPADPRVSLTMFTSKDWADERSAARDFIERYLARGGRWHGWLYERQLAGQRVIQIWQRVELELPAVGSVFCLVNNRGKADEVEQYVRISRISDQVREFTHAQAGVFKRRIVTCEITDPLRHDFVGAEITPYDAEADAAPAILLRTVVADAARYYGVSRLAQPGRLGDMRIRVDSIFSQLVPSARAETPIVDVNAGGEAVAVVPSGTSVSFGYDATLSPTVPLYLGTACQPGSLRIVGPGYTLTDAGGELKAGSSSVGIVDYARGLVQVAPGGSTFAGSKAVSYKPAGAPVRVMDTAIIDVSLENRGFAYTITLPVTPTPGSLVVSFMAQGKWYDLRDNGAGALKGSDASFGAGSVNFATGSVIVTLGAQPDVGSAILFSWASPTSYFDRSGQTIAAPALRVKLFDPDPAAPAKQAFDSVKITWTDGTKTLTALADSLGRVTGDATGFIRADGQAEIRPAKAPLGNTEFTFTFNRSARAEAVYPLPALQPAGTRKLILPAPLRPGFLELTLPLELPPQAGLEGWPKEFDRFVGDPGVLYLRDDGQGGFLGLPAGMVASVDYATGTVTLPDKVPAKLPRQKYRRDGERYVMTGWDYGDALCPYGSAGITVGIRVDDVTTAATQKHVLSELQIDVTEGFAERIVAGSIAFEYAGRRYVDIGGRLVVDVNPATGAGVTAGQINYQTGLVTIRAWTPGQANAVALRSLLTEIGGQAVDEVAFRVPVAPMRPGSLSVSATSVDGAVARVDSDMDSYFGNEMMQGRVDYATGVVKLRFGRLVTAAGQESQPWYDPDRVVDGKIWRPMPVMADTIRYNAVGYTYLPMDSEVLGLDAVRLPGDGRVPIFTSDNVVVVHHTGRFELPNPVSGGVPYGVGRGRLAALEVVDSTGKKMPRERYLADLDTGKVTLKTPLDLSGLVPPLTVEHRIEDMARCYDVQISGEIALTRQLSHDYPAGETMVSSALILGDLSARYSKLFVQQSWTGAWQDVPGGAPILAQYNDAQHPIICVNDGAIQQRWAVIFTSPSDFRVIGETLGQIATGSVNADCSPTNPSTGKPFFTLKAAGWGTGWSVGNVLRFNTIGAAGPIWLARTVLMGPATADDDRFMIQIRGDADRQ